MARHNFYVFFILLAFMHNAGGSLQLDIWPTNISSGLTRSLTVNCSFAFSQSSDISDIISLIISKSEDKGNQQDQFQDLVSLNIFSADQVNVLSPINGSVSGYIDGDGESYLTIQWTYPGNDQAGLYRCEVHGMDSTGHPSEVVKNVTVTSEQPDMDQLINKVSDLQRQLDSQENLTTHLETQLGRQEKMITQQSHLIDTLLSLTKNQSESMSSVQAELKLVRDLSMYFDISSLYQGHMYLLSKKGWTYSTEAEQTCKDYEGYLAQIDDSGEDTFVNDFLLNFFDFAKYYFVLVSGTNKGHEGYWTYTGTNRTMTYINWGGREPDQPEFQCIAKYKEYQWKCGDYLCDTTYSHTSFLCEVNVK